MDERENTSWTSLIDEIVAGDWVNPESGKAVDVPYESIVIEDSLEGRAADLVASLNLGKRFTVVADANTRDALGARIASELEALGPVDTVILDHPHADMANVDALTDKLAHAEVVVAVGSGTINDLCKFVTGRTGRKYCVFGTAGSMNGYTSTTASITLESGLKVSIPSHAPSGFFVDLGIAAAAPTYLSAAGFGDCLCRSVAQVDWWMSHRLLRTDYHSAPFLIQERDEAALNGRAAGIARHDLEANGYLFRVLTLCGLGVSFTGVSNHGSMGEHQISHYIDCFAGDRHPGTLHGTQVGVASLTMARLQHRMLASEAPPRLEATRIDFDDMVRRMGPDVAEQCLAEMKKKAFDADGAARFNDRLAEIWPTLKEEVRPFMLPVEEMTEMLAATGGPTTAAEMGASADLYREAVVHCREMRNRFSFLDIAADAGMLEDFAAEEA